MFVLIDSSSQGVSDGVWRPDKELCQITQGRGNELKCLGFTFEKAVHLLPEETLYLMERGKLAVPNITVEELYELVDLSDYLVYTYFKQTTLIVFRVEEDCPVPVVFEAYAPNSKFSKNRPGEPIMYIMHGR
jgi:hypothetical protein